MSEKNKENLLSFDGSENFRKFLVEKNLKPYQNIEGYSSPEFGGFFEYKLSTFTPKDQKNIIETNRELTRRATITNEYNQINKIDGGEILGGNAGAVSLQQTGPSGEQELFFEKTSEYSLTSSKLEIINEFFIDAASIVNRYTPPGGFIDTYISTDNIKPKFASLGREYPNFENLEKNIESFAQTKGFINVYTPLDGFFGPIKLNTNLPKTNFPSAKEYPNFSYLNENNWIKYQTAIASINQYIPENGYVSQIVLQTNVKNKSSVNEYRNSIVEDKELIENLKKEITINRYQPTNGLFNIYSNQVFSLSKIFGKPKEYNSATSSIIEFNKQNQVNAASINKFIPENGYTDTVFLTLNTLTKESLNIGGYYYSTITDEEILKNVRERFTINKYQPQNGDYNFYTYNLLVPSKDNKTSSEYKTPTGLLLEINKNTRTAAAATNKFRPAYGYNNEISIITNPISNTSQNNGEYYFVNEDDKTNIEKAKKEILNNRYQPSNGFFNFFTNSYTTLSKLYGYPQEYNAQLNSVLKIYKEEQLRLASINKFKPEQGYNNIVNLGLNVLNTQSQVYTEYSSTVNTDESILSKTKENISVNRYQADGGVYNLYGSTLFTLTKLYNSGQEYKTNNNVLDNINRDIKTQLSSINKFSPTDGFVNEFFFRLSTLQKNQNGIKEYEKSTITENEIIKNTQKEISINKYQPSSNFYNLYTTKLFTLKNSDTVSSEYDGPIFEYSELERQSRDFASGLNKFSPLEGYTYEVSLETNSIAKGKNKLGEYSNSTQNEQDLLKNTKEEIALNRYQPLGLYNLYSNSLNALSKLKSGAQEYNQNSNSVVEVNSENRAFSSTMNKYGPQFGYITEIIINTSSLEKDTIGLAEYPSLLTPDTDLLIKTQTETAVNRYGVNNGQLDVYTQKTSILPKARSSSQEYVNSDLFYSNTSKISQNEAATKNKYKPYGGYNYEIQLEINNSNSYGNQVNEYFNSTKTDSEIIEIVKDEISINRYQPIGLYNVYSNNLVSLEKIGSDSKEYTIGVNPIEQSYKKIQLDAAAANRYSPDGGYVSLIQIDSTSLVKNDSETSEYPNNVENDEILIQNTLDEISLNRYTATNGQILIYSQNIKILPKIGGSSDQYINSDIFISPTTKIFQTEAAAINKYIPDGGYKYEADLRVIPLQSNIQFKGEYNSEIASSFNNFEDTTEAVLINKYRPNGGLLNVYSNSLVTPLITNNTPQEYSTESDFIFKLNKVSRTIASTSNRYSPNLGYSESVTINSINLTKIEGFNNEYPDNISESQDLLERTKTELAINRYSATGGDLGIYSQNLTILPKVGSGSQEYINSDLFLILSSNKLRTDAAKINKWIPEDGYNSEYILSINALEKNKIQTPYPLNGTDQLEIKNNIEQEFAATYNKFIPDDGYKQQYSNVSVILPKGNENIYGISNEEELFPNIPPLTTKQEILNRYTPDYGFDFLYSPTIHILEKNPQLTKEYPNFLIPDDTLFDTAIVDINALLNGNTNILINPQESYLQQISVRFLAESFRDRIQREIERQTIGRVNLQAFSDPFSLSLLVSGQEPLIYKNFTITVPDGVFDQAAYLIQRFSGTYIPVSPIEGEYFTTYPEKEKTQVGQVIDDFLSFFTKPTTPTNRSIKFLNNTGAGQKSVLFTSLEYNVYRPKYDKNLTQIGTLIDNFLDFTNNPLGLGNNSIGNLYIPYDSEDIQNLSVQTGLDELGKTFEGPEIDNRNFGLKSLPYNEDTDPSGGFAWTQSSSIDLAGKFLGTDGLQGPQSPDYQGNTQIKLNSSRSDTLSFRERSILKRTQEIVDNAPTTGVKRYSSAGNAINQISKVFHDGYKEMTKGSRVKKYLQKNGKEEGVEYGRTFTKDIPYLNYNNLQTTIANNSGLETNGNIRKFTNSILDSTYNLNIAPTFGQDSTNIKDNRVKKYMFSIENLAWRGTDEFNNLPDCEKGPNGGRIMWFPPYGLDVGTETSSPTFNATNFLGRPEPIYTYENTKRSGSVSWQILVDHPSVTDIVVKYELEKEDGNIATQVINSFFSGLKKYDIYELAKKYGTMSLTTLESVYQNALQSNQVSDEDKQLVLLEIGPNSNNLATSNSPTDLSGNFVNTNFYFPVTFNSTLDEYSLIYDDYTALKSSYISLNFISPPSVETFFDTYLTQNYESLTNLRQAVGEILQGGKEKVEIVVQKVKTLGTVENDTLWYGAIENFFGEYILENSKRISEYLNKSLILKEEVGELGIVTPKSESGLGGEINCNTQSIGEPNLNYSFWAAACRGYIVKRIIVTPNENAEIDSEQNQNSNPIPQSQFGLNPQQTTNILRNATSVTKKVIRELLTEMNYFEVLKKDQSFIYDSIKTKFKFFNPAFHSMTPEGLNSRLVFLQQCVRPGRTIPVRQEDGSSVTTDSYNTNFGTPPILVLRIGDFFHTKIVPTQLSITYEPLWDYNPEGIGFQPMIAKVSLGYDMIGGQGLEGPVEQLQNALSFNYYANTEMYDERATPTEDLTVVTNEILQQLSAQQPTPVQNNAGPQETDLGNTFGNVVTTTQLANGGQIGDIKYKSFFNLFVELTEEYFQSSINTYESVITQYNKGIWSQFVNQRHFYQGFFQTLQTPIFAPLIGKSVYYQNVLQNYGAYYADLMPTSDRLALEFEKNFTAGTINALTKQKLIDNYASFIIATSNSHFTYLPTASQEMANSQLPLTMYMQKMDFVSFSGDGKVLNSGGNKLLFLSGQTENSSNSLDKFKSDYNFVMQDLSGFTNYTIGILTLTPQDTSGEFSTFTPVTVNFDFMDDFAFTLFSDTILDSGKKQNFINIITNGIETQNLTKCTQIINEVIDNYWYPQFTEEKNAEIDELNALKEEEFIKQKLSYNPQINGVSITTRDRIMSYSTIGNQSSYLSPFNNIKISQNTNSDPTSYNGKKQYNG